MIHSEYLDSAPAFFVFICAAVLVAVALFRERNKLFNQEKQKRHEHNQENKD